jgi:AcrR family transcriptional regulator
MATDRQQGRSEQTTARYMDAAEALFITLGYEGTSIRAISSRAKMNLGTVVYHWGTKRELFRAICLRRFSEIEVIQIERLRALRSRSDPLTPRDLELVLTALVEPPLTHSDDPEIRNITGSLYGRVLTDPSPTVLEVSAEIFSEATVLLKSLIRDCLPGISDEDFFWRYTCALGAFIFAQSFQGRIAYATDVAIGEADWAAVSRRIVTFMAAGLRSEAAG